jgi:hypothetical protein
MAVLKPRKRPQYLEAIEQRLFIKRLRLDPRTKDLPWCSVPNGGKRNAREAALLKAEGVQAGVPDWLCFVASMTEEPPCDDPPSFLWHGLAIEFKSPSGKGKVSPAQQEWHERLRDQGWLVEVCTTAEEAWRLTMEYLHFEL